jgi:hypothetical protein
VLLTIASKQIITNIASANLWRGRSGVILRSMDWPALDDGVAALKIRVDWKF